MKIDLSPKGVQAMRQFLIDNPHYFCDEVVKMKIKEPHPIIFMDEYFLCEIWVVGLLKKKQWDSRRQKKSRKKAIVKVVDCVNDKGNCIFPRFNGCWAIPDMGKR